MGGEGIPKQDLKNPAKRLGAPAPPRWALTFAGGLSVGGVGAAGVLGNTACRGAEHRERVGSSAPHPGPAPPTPLWVSCLCSPPAAGCGGPLASAPAPLQRCPHLWRNPSGEWHRGRIKAAACVLPGGPPLAAPHPFLPLSSGRTGRESGSLKAWCLQTEGVCHGGHGAPVPLTLVP